MCAKHFKPVLTSRCGDVSEDKTPSPVRGNTVRSRYRVLGVLPRGSGLSVDRNCAGPKAKSKETSLKGSSPVKHYIPWWPSKYVAAKAAPMTSVVGTTGVQDLGMYRRLILELGRSLEGRSVKIRFGGQSFDAKSKIIPTREVRWPRSSWEVR